MVKMRRSCYGILSVLLGMFNSSFSATSGDFKKFLDEPPYSTYNKKIFPRSTQTDVVVVEIDLSLVAITDFDEQGGQLDMVGFLTAKWTTDILKWDITTSHQIESLLLPQNNFWRPSLVLANSVASLKELGDNNYRIRLDYQGNCEWTIGLVSQTGCTVNVEFYPFDKQTCTITLTAWGYTDSQVRLNTTATGVDTSLYMDNVEWSFTSSSVESTSISGASYLVYTINLTRKPGYFLVNMIIPILILGLLNGLVFLVPADSGERVGYSITAFLTFAVFLTMVAENLPKASEPMSLLCYFLTLMLVMSALSTVVTIMILRVHHQDEDSPVPNYIRHIVSFITCRKCKKWCGKKKVSKNAVADMIENDDDDISNADVESMAPPPDDSDIKAINWRIVSSTLDGVFFVIFLLTTIALSVYFLLPIFLYS